MLVPGCPREAVFLKVGTAGTLPLGVGEFSGTPVSSGSGERQRRGWQSFHDKQRGDEGRMWSWSRLSPEKGALGCLGGEVRRTPMLADGCLSSPPTSSSTPLLGALSP